MATDRPRPRPGPRMAPEAVAAPPGDAVRAARAVRIVLASLATLGVLASVGNLRSGRGSAPSLEGIARATGGGQTISQPYIVALMTALLGLPAQSSAPSRVLEIGTGSGYQAAVLSRVAAQVYSVEIVADLGARARDTRARLGYENVQVRIGDGYRGWPEAAPFDGILLTAAPRAVPPPLIAQLKPGGRMVLPIGGL